MTKLFMYHDRNTDKVRVLLLAPTGVAAINISGITVHSGLNIPYHSKILSLSNKIRALVRKKYSEVQLIIIDKISMVPNKLLFYVHQRLIENFESPSDNLLCLVVTYISYLQSEPSHFLCLMNMAHCICGVTER